MIVTEQKDFDEIKGLLKDDENIIIIGCGRCCTSCSTGGEKEVLEMKKKLEKEGKNIVSYHVIEAPCDERLIKKELKKFDIKKADCVLAMCCGGGASSINDLVGIKVYPALNSLFSGVIKRLGLFHERCSMCGDCSFDKFGGICPVTRCSKGLLNGPCGGSIDGKCEVNNEKDCGWALITEALKKQNKIAALKEFKKPKDSMLSKRPQVVDKTKNGV